MHIIMSIDHHSDGGACDHHSDDSEDYSSWGSVSDLDQDGDNDELDGGDCSRPTMACIVAYRERALAIFCGISLPDARSAPGRDVPASVLAHIATLAAPYIICDKF